jgi:hypothetical protein
MNDRTSMLVAALSDHFGVTNAANVSSYSLSQLG